MSGGSSWDPLEDVKNMGKNPIDSILDVVANVATFGLVGYEEGKAKEGSTTNFAKQAFMSTSGANAGINESREKMNDLQIARDNEEMNRKDGLRRREAAERQASDMGKILRSGKSGSGGNTGTDSIEQTLADQALGL